MNSEFEKNGYFIIRNFLPEDFCKFAQHYFYIKYNALDYNIDEQCPLSKSWYADYLTETLLLTSLEKLQEMSGVELRPTYSYTRIYSPEDELKIHTDRPECQFSATLCLGRPMDEENNPIYFSQTEIKTGATPLYLNPGDLCFYMGNRMYHWRDKFTQSWYLQTFLHYVDANGEYANNVYDGRPFLGMQKDN